MKVNPFLLTDYYKVGHVFQYPDKTELVYSNLTPRKSRLQDIDEMVFFGLQYFIKEYLVSYFNEEIFQQPKEKVMADYKRRIVSSLGAHLPSYEHLAALHDLGYLPVEIKALPEGSRVPMRVPCLTIVNTISEFYWLTNFLETLLSAVIWQPSTSATIAYTYRKLLNKYACETGMPMDFVQWQGHDFSFRGMSSLETSVLSGMGHLLSFTGTDTIPAIDALEQYYNANADLELIGGSVAATEHSVMCSGSKDGELETFKRLITQVYPTGIVSIVSDTWDLWKVCTEYLPALKEIITNRNGKVVIRPDSGDPVKIICGDPDGNTEAERRGVIELLWDVFGGTVTDKGFKLLDPHIGAIYGDSINIERATLICERLKAKGFASQVVFGIGSYTYQYNTRDTFGTAMKATYVVVDGEGREIFKDPVTDDGTKRSATGLLQVKRENGSYVLIDRVSWEEEKQGELRTVFKDGKLVRECSLRDIRKHLSVKI
ncbi:nicotinate phosphoribosyltransferase [Flavihumibacter solisilvae]|uniref:Nicotinamide phosphoribosyltransferase n=1 Tax=Flavihumibacter solisilvae TaxID=1349421 RepID=A0A0C1IUR3_9BACT|nr:nicotinate phosphoribosyltransferase [Flavihumibacter solisilvae]KIC94234.1 nicotinate phosphoribosyltransferase [Flavihumibacter solisilvae]